MLFVSLVEKFLSILHELGLLLSLFLHFFLAVLEQGQYLLLISLNDGGVSDKQKASDH